MGDIPAAAAPPFVGCIYKATRSKSGRLWRLQYISRWEDRNRNFAAAWYACPLGDDVRPAQEGNKFNGGVRGITIEHYKLINPLHSRNWRLATPDECAAIGERQPANLAEWLLREVESAA